MVSRKRFYDDLHVSAEGDTTAADLGFLLLAMKLMTWRPPSSEGDAPVVNQTARTATYRAAKQFGFELETAGVISLRVLQGMILVALYEIGHAIYPAAFMSVAASIRYAHGLGIQPGGMQRLKLPLTWVEEEERKRVWWSAFLLDRLSGMACPGCPAAIDEPRPEDPLPTDDALWDEGATKVPFSPLLKNPVSMEFGRFALLIQAFVLLSKVLRLTSSRDEQSHLLKDEAQQLERTVKALLYFGQMECKWRNGVPSCELHSISHISLITMYTSSKIPVEMPDNFVEPLADVLNSSNYEHMVTAARRGRDEISPFLIQILYQTSVQLLKRERPKNGGDWGETRVEKLKGALMWLDKRWQLAGVFRQALEAQQIALSRET
ncbi:transcriptional regulator family: Fungal Specific TF [Trichoderma aggressivum f. europaeum]|uniref:Transcriptional regulator family: Fungal Specific TF n=1 Tax=Trichoderma aggressivum f. europaeum TaxID=173218 RepID=A0AAE1LVV9_9HYPO|nr:transcriptional regulator family: Fungal Specific TF [Trichoderma aggressivum f. europaeum]